MKRLGNRGETIVEVLISIAVVAGVLAGSYYVINRSYRQSQGASERVAAVKAAESKTETLRAMGSSALSNIAFSRFCIDSGTLTAYDATTDTSDTSCKVEPRYVVTITKNSSVYEITASWDGLLSSTEQVTIYYKP